ncbi:MAG: sulfite exporter TauE/SafE family protein, partial [Acidimicrobiia bacterium]|nr:sulfite exporter TauE/SafE family protein [Acidimicrobiia bacterium]
METDVTATVVLAVAAAAFLIGLAKGGLPGFGPIVTVIVALAVPANVAIGILLPILMVGDVVALWALRGNIDRSVVRAIIPGSVVGVALASFVLSSLSADALELGIVIVVLLFVAYRTAVLTGRAPTLGA